MNTASGASVFDAVDRVLVGGAPYLLSHFDYLNTSDRPEAERVRGLIDEWLARYAASDRDRLRDRLRSIDDIGHLGAFFELALHELLIRAGFRIVAVEPAVERSRRVPDFLVETSDGGRFFLEATLATGRSQAGAAAQRRLDQAFKTIDSVPSPDFFLSLATSGTPTAMITGRTLKRELRQWLAGLDYDAVTTAWSGNGDAVPVFRYEEHGVRFRISPVPRRRSRGAQTPGRAIGGRMLDPLTVQPQEPIRDAVAGKATRYGDLDLPYVVAVNAMSDYADKESVIDALFGSPAVAVRRTETGYEDRATRLPDGVWRGQSRPINTRVSGVISTERLTPWSVGQRRARLIVNPWARRPLTDDRTFGIDRIWVDDNRLRREEGEDLATRFGLPTGWPE